MKYFLEYVADDILQKYGDCLSDVVVVFPNKRASLFLNKYLYERIGHAFWSPRYITISELFRMQSDLTVADQIKTNCMMHKVFTECTGSAESIDEFWGWGQMILSDFDDIDKNLGDASQVFTNISDIHALDTMEFLDEEQKEIIRQFFKQFSDDPESRLKQRFLTLWNNLHNIYLSLNSLMRSEGLAYEGALYREVAERASTLEWKHKHYLFVGFNMIQKCEQALFSSMKSQGLAHFYWDFDHYYMHNPTQEAGSFINEYLVRFPNELDIKNEDLYCNLTKPKDVTFLSASTENIQARYITDWLRQNGRIEAGERTAIVLADESLLKSVIHYLPKEVSGKANITVGYPLSQSPAATLVSSFVALHTISYKQQSGVFMQKPVIAMLCHPYINLISAKADEVLERLQKNRIFFPKREDLCIDEGLTLLFEPIDCNLSDVNSVITKRLAELLKIIGRNSEATRLEELAYNGIAPEDVTLTYEEQFMQESLFQMSKVVNRLKDLIDQDILHSSLFTLHSLLTQIIQSTSMPFHGEPAVGVQIMGVLETRNLDFDHVLMLSCNEGNLPKGINDSSLIPYSIRKAHNLTTIDRKVAIYAYYFYRLLQRANDVSITYNNATDDGHTGQRSRFMLQLMVENTAMNISLKDLTAKQLPATSELKSIAKNENTMQVLNQLDSLSPSAIATYMRCPLLFYYQKIANIREADAEDINDARSFGKIFHRAAELIYLSLKDANNMESKESLQLLINEKNHPTVKRFVDQAFSDVLFNGGKPHYDGLQIINYEVINRLVINLLKADEQIAPLCIMGIEGREYEKMEIETEEGPRTISVGGIVDRIDSITDSNGKEVIRIVDYKTGGSPAGPFTVEELFDKANVDKHSHYYLQSMLYAMIVRHKKGIPTLPALLYIRNQESTADPVLRIGTKKDSEPINDIADYEKEFTEGLHLLIKEILSPQVPFHPTVNTKRCEYCSFAQLCKS